MANLCLTLCKPMDCSLPGFSVHGISQVRILSELPFLSPGDLPHPHPLYWQVDSLPLREVPKAYQFRSVQSLSHVRLFATPWTAACQASLSITNSQSLPKPMSTKSVMPSNHLILCHSPFLPALNLSQHQGLFQWVSSSHQVAKVLEFQLQHQSFQWIPRTDLL